MVTEVKTLYKSNARDIPAMLRKLAQDIESPPAGAITPNAAVCVIFDTVTGQYNTYGWGDTTLDLSIVFLSIARNALLRIRDGGILWPIPHGGVK